MDTEKNNNLRLVDAPGGAAAVKLCIYSSSGRSFWSDEAWLDEGRPPALASLNLATWSLLATSIKEYQTALGVKSARLYFRFILPLYFIWFFTLFILDFTNDLVFWIHWSCLIAIILGARIGMYSLHQNHAKEVFHPAVQTVLEELGPRLQETGYNVVLLQEPGDWCWKPSKSFLQFVPILDEEKGGVPV